MHPVISTSTVWPAASDGALAFLLCGAKEGISREKQSAGQADA